MSSNKIKPTDNLIKAVNLYTNRMRKSRKESIKNDLSSFIIWLTECLEPKSYNEDDDLDNINLNLIEPSFIEQYVQITNIKHSNFNASKKLTVEGGPRIKRWRRPGKQFFALRACRRPLGRTFARSFRSFFAALASIRAKK